MHHASINTRYGHQIKELVIRFCLFLIKRSEKDLQKCLHENVLVFSDIQAEQQMSIHMDINEEDDFENAEI